MLWDKYKDAEMTESWIREHIDDCYFDWDDIYSAALSIDFIREFKDKVLWRNISEYKQLTDKDISEFKDKVSWGKVCTYQKPSTKLLERFIEDVNWEFLGTNTPLTQSFVLKHKDKINWRIMVTYQDFTSKFWRKAIKYVPSPWVRDAIRQRYNIK